MRAHTLLLLLYPEEGKFWKFSGKGIFRKGQVGP
jgi:hypothetical protein